MMKRLPRSCRVIFMKKRRKRKSSDSESVISSISRFSIPDIESLIENNDVNGVKEALAKMELLNLRIEHNIKNAKDWLVKTFTVSKKQNITIGIDLGDKGSFIKVKVSTTSTYKDIRRKAWDENSERLIKLGYTRTSFEMATTFDMEYGKERLSQHPRAPLSKWKMIEGDVLRLVPKDELTKKRITKKQQALSEAMGKRDDKKHKDNKKDDEKKDDEKKGTKGTSSSSGYPK